MSVDGVNQNSSNNKVNLYATGAATVLGGGIGAGTGYFSKPFLNKDKASDAFIKKMIDIADNNAPEKMNVLKNDFKSIIDTSDSLAELKTRCFDFYSAHAKDKASVKKFERTFENLTNGMNLKDAKESVQNCFDHFVGIQQRKNASEIFAKIWDSEKKCFKKDVIKNNPVYEAVYKAAKSMKRQAVLINGAISAAILGVATFIAANSALKNQQVAQTDAPQK